MTTSYLGLNIHSFIVAALGVLAAFQLVIFGVAAALYGVEAGKKPPWWLLRVISVRFRLAVGVIGLVLMLGSFAKLIQLTIQWAGNNVFTDTRGLVLTTSFLVLGLQIISAVLFISIFSGRLSRLAEEGLDHLVSVVVVNYNGADALEGCLARPARRAATPRSSRSSSWTTPPPTAAPRSRSGSRTSTSRVRLLRSPDQPRLRGGGQPRPARGARRATSRCSTWTSSSAAAGSIR